MVDFGRKFIEGYGLGQAIRQKKRSSQLEELSKQYFTGKRPEALSQIASIDPSRAMGISQFEMGREKLKQIPEERQIARGAQIASTIKNTPEEMRSFAYQQGLRIAKEEGIDVSDLPQEYNQQADFFLDSIINKARDVEKILAEAEEKERKVVKDIAGSQR